MKKDKQPSRDTTCSGWKENQMSFHWHCLEKAWDESKVTCHKNIDRLVFNMSCKSLYKEVHMFCRLCYRCISSWSFFLYNWLVEHPSQVEPETLAVIKWMQNYNFVLSANLHGGAVVANYPFDKSRDPRIRGRTTYAATPDDKIFRKV